MTSCQNMPKDMKQRLLKEAKQKLKQRERQPNKKRIFLGHRKPDELAEQATRRQTTLDSLQDIFKTEFDTSFAEIMYHGRAPLHTFEDVMLRRYIVKLTKCTRAGLPHAQVYFPNRHKLADGLLDEMNDKTSQEIARVFAADHHTGLATDGYSNIGRNSVSNCNLIGGRESVFVKADYPSKQIKDADRIAQGINDALEVGFQLIVL